MKKFVPTTAMVEAAENVFLTMTFEQTIRPVVVKYKTAILAEGQWRIRPQYTERLGGEMIHDPKQAYLMADDDFAVYDAKCKQARALAGLQVDNDDQCPLLVAELLVSQAEHALITVMSETTKVTVHKLLCAGMEKYKSYVDLTLRLLSPFVKNDLAALLA